MKTQVFNSEAMFGYKQISTFFSDFSIAEIYSRNKEKAVRETFKLAFKGWKDNYKMLTELVMVLNWKSWQHAEKGDYDLSEVYVELYEKAREYAFENLKDEELKYFFDTTD